MPIFIWKGGNSGDFNIAGNWTPGQVPGAADDAQITAIGTYTVTSSTSNTVNTLEMVATATLAVTVGTFSISNGSGASGLAGTIAVSDAAVLSLAGTIDNTGTIKLGAAADTTELRIASPSVTLKGGGTVSLSNSASNFIFGNSSAFVLNNVDNLIQGAGQIGDGQMNLINGGQIVANQTVALVINTGNYVQNAGILKSTNTSTNAGGLVINNTTIDNSGKANAGKIEAIGANTHVDVENATVVGGTLITSGGGVIQMIGGGTLDGLSSGFAIKNAGTVRVNNGTSLTLDGVINNVGTIQAMATANTADIRLGSQTVTLEGGGKVTLSNSVNNRLYGNSGSYQLVNVDNTISGAGQLGSSQLTLVNQTKGVINANQAVALTLQTGGALTFNTGLLEDTGTGGLVLANVIDNASGTIEAVGAGAHVDLAGANIEGGTLLAAGGGKIQTVPGSGTLDGLTAGSITIKGTVTVSDQTTLTLAGTIDNTGTIAMNAISTSGTTDLRVNSQTVTLEGGGRITLSNDTNNRIFGNSIYFQLINVDNTIAGAGQLGVGGLTLINQTNGVINANQRQSLTLNGGGGNPTVNAGLMEDTSTGGLVIVNTVDNAAGTIQAVGTGAHVDLAGGIVEGGSLVTSGGGVFQTVAGSGNLDGLTAGGLRNAATFRITDNTSLTIEGAFFNTGSISLNSGVDNTDLRINSQLVTLKGGGKIILSNSATNRIYSTNSADQLINVDNTISGAGQIGVGQLMLVNQTKGVINANQRTALTLNGGSSLMMNSGLIEDTNTGGLVIASVIDNAGGRIVASGTGAAVNLAGGFIEGGTLATVGAGAIQTGSGGGNLDGITAGKITLSGTFNVTDNTALTLEGVVNNVGTINLASGGDNTDIRVNSQTVTLVGGGKVRLTDFGTNRIYGNSSLFTLNNVNNTIIGSGQIGAGQMQFVNSGTINAVGGSGLTVALGIGQGTNAASGVLEASGAGGLTFTSGLINNNGKIIALDNSFVTFTGASADNNASGVLTGGIWQASSTTHASTLSITGGAVTQDAATIILSGAGSVFQAGNGSTFTPLEQSLTMIDAGAALELLGGRSYTTSLGVTDAGLLQLAGGTFKGGAFTVATGGRVLGFGTIMEPVADKGTIEAAGGKLSITGAVSGAGGLKIDASSSLQLQGAVGTAATVTFAGTKSTLILTDGSAFSGTVSGFAAAASESIDVTTVAFSSATKLTYSATSQNLTVTDGTHSATIHLFQQYVAAGFHGASDGSGGTTITYVAPPAALGASLASPHH